MVKYKVINGEKCVNLDMETCLAVDIKGWSRIFMYSDRDLVIKESCGLRLYDANTD
jgi:hypothetical protein